MTSSLLLVALAGLIYISLMGLGLGVARLCRRGSVDSPGQSPMSPVIMGLAVVQVVAWYVLQFTDAGVSRAFMILALLSLCGLVAHFIGRGVTVRSEVRRLLSDHWVAGASAVIFAISWWPLMKFGYLTAAGGNGDVAAYAQVAQHIRHHGFADVGRILGADLGTVSRTDASGAYMVLAYAKGIVNRPYNGIMLPVLATFVAVVAQQGKVIISRISTMSQLRATIIVLIPQSTFMMVYLTANYFLAQFVSMAAFFALVLSCMWIRGSIESGSRIGPGEIVLASTPPIVLLVTYPHMAFVVVPVAIVALSPFRNWTSLRRYLISFAGAGVVTVVVCFQKLQVGLERFFKLAGDTTSGWPLPSLSPAAILGFQSDPYHRANRIDLLMSAVIVVVVLIAVLVLWRNRTSSGGLLLLVFAVSAACVLMNISAADTYRNWKWTTYFIPLLIVGGLWAVATALHRFRVMSSILMLGLLVLLPVNLTRSRTYMRMVATATPVVTYDLSQLGSSPALRGLTEVNVRTGPFLGSMWPTLFLEPLHVRILEPSYYSAPLPFAGPTIVRDNGQIASSRVRSLGNGYALVDYPAGVVTTSTESFAAVLEPRALPSTLVRGKKHRIKMSVQNTGLSTWLGSGSWTGSVNVGARLLDPVSRKPLAEIGRGAIAPFPDYVMPGEKRSVTMEITTSVAPGSYLLDVSPVIEQIKWMGEISPKFHSVTSIEIR